MYYTLIARPITHESFLPTYEKEPEPSIDPPPPPPGMLLNTQLYVITKTARPPDLFPNLSVI